MAYYDSTFVSDGDFSCTDTDVSYASSSSDDDFSDFSDKDDTGGCHGKKYERKKTKGEMSATVPLPTLRVGKLETPSITASSSIKTSSSTRDSTGNEYSKTKILSQDQTAETMRALSNSASQEKEVRDFAERVMDGTKVDPPYSLDMIAYITEQVKNPEFREPVFANLTGVDQKLVASEELYKKVFSTREDILCGYGQRPKDTNAPHLVHFTSSFCNTMYTDLLFGRKRNFGKEAKNHLSYLHQRRVEKITDKDVLVFDLMTMKTLVVYQDGKCVILYFQEIEGFPNFGKNVCHFVKMIVKRIHKMQGEQKDLGNMRPLEFADKRNIAKDLRTLSFLTIHFIEKFADECLDRTESLKDCVKMRFSRCLRYLNEDDNMFYYRKELLHRLYPTLTTNLFENEKLKTAIYEVAKDKKLKIVAAKRSQDGVTIVSLTRHFSNEMTKLFKMILNGGIFR